MQMKQCYTQYSNTQMYWHCTDSHILMTHISQQTDWQPKCSDIRGSVVFVQSQYRLFPRVTMKWKGMPPVISV